MHQIFTIGHSTRAIDEFIELLKTYSITLLVDIRTIPKSRYNPQYEQNALEKSLQSQDIEYAYIKNLGGLRTASKDSVNDAWRNKSFRNYADHMQSAEFRQGLEELLRLTEQATVAIMCAEAVPWRCHRSLVADALVARSFPVCEIISKGNVREHVLTSFAVVQGQSITYPKTA